MSSRLITSKMADAVLEGQQQYQQSLVDQGIEPEEPVEEAAAVEGEEEGEAEEPAAEEPEAPLAPEDMFIDADLIEIDETLDEE